MTTLSFHKSAEWKTGFRSYFEYRDLGIVGASKGKVLAHQIRGQGIVQRSRWVSHP